MNVIKSKLNVDIEVDVTFTEQGQVCIEVFMGDSSSPVSFSTQSLYSLVKEFADAASDDTGEITDNDCVEMSYNIITELQDAIDLLNESIGDIEDES
jgi:hypothetical protein